LRRRPASATAMTRRATAGGAKNPGSVRIGEEKVPVTVPRMIDTETGETCSPERYHEMKELPEMTRKVQEAILLGLSQNDYERVASRALSEARK